MGQHLKILTFLVSLFVLVFMAEELLWNNVCERISLSEQQPCCINKFTCKGDYPRFDGYAMPRRKRYFGSKIRYYSNSYASFQLLCLVTSGDINPNPGPELSGKKYLCTICDKTLTQNQRSECTRCCLKFHVKCSKI